MENQNVVEKKTSGLAVAAFVCGIACLICNPLSLVTLAAIILGIVALATKAKPAWMSIVGLSLGGVSVLGELIMAIFTLGMSLFI